MDKPWLTTEYKQHLRSRKWKLLCSEKKRQAGGQCEKCGCYWILQVHHVTYERLGNERLSDLMAVCKFCHEEMHDKIQADRDADRSRRLQEAQLDGWSTKKYGERWQDEQDIERVEEEFDSFLERIEDR
jgi:5-methylcytosine-specific restriction endonuclease McrA